MTAPSARAVAGLGGAASVAVRVHGRLEGRGTAYDGLREIAAVDYALKDVDEVYHAAPAPEAAPTEVVGARTLYGVIRTPHAAALGAHVGDRLVLHMEGGRRLDFTVAKVLTADSVLVQGLGDMR